MNEDLESYLTRLAVHYPQGCYQTNMRNDGPSYGADEEFVNTSANEDSVNSTTQTALKTCRARLLITSFRNLTQHLTFEN